MSRRHLLRLVIMFSNRYRVVKNVRYPCRSPGIHGKQPSAGVSRVFRELAVKRATRDSFKGTELNLQGIAP